MKHETRDTKHATRDPHGTWGTQYAVFLDRDGTINRERAYLGRPEGL